MQVLFQYPPLWISFEGSCYKHFRDPRNWTDAKAFCNAIGAQLVKIESADENEFIKREVLPGSGRYWIGLTDAGTENDWKWSDGSKLAGYTHWSLGQLNNTKQDCVVIRKGHDSGIEFGGQWYNSKCHTTRKFICEM